MDYQLMLMEIHAIADSIDLDINPNTKVFTQAEARSMLEKIGEIYHIAHAVHCDPCSKQYQQKEPLSCYPFT